MNYFKYFENFINVMMHGMDPETDHTRSGPVLGDLKTARASQHMQSVPKKNDLSSEKTSQQFGDNLTQSVRVRDFPHSPRAKSPADRHEWSQGQVESALFVTD